jgi:uncharacterized protein (DUF169 family)
MRTEDKAIFLELYKRYFGSAELPVTFYYTDSPVNVEYAKVTAEHRCIICDLAEVRNGNSLCFDSDSAVCGGAKRYLGFRLEIMPNFEYFLSHGIPGKLEGERYKKSPELVQELMEKAPFFSAPAKYIVFKRWDKLDEEDEPEVVVFFAKPDVLSGLFTLSGFDEATAESVIVPFAAGCGSIVQYPYLELLSGNNRSVLGMFDVSARPCVPADRLSFAVPMPRFRRMVENMEESFLITDSWRKVKQRLDKGD